MIKSKPSWHTQPVWYPWRNFTSPSAVDAVVVVLSCLIMNSIIALFYPRVPWPRAAAHFKFKWHRGLRRDGLFVLWHVSENCSSDLQIFPITGTNSVVHVNHFSVLLVGTLAGQMNTSAGTFFQLTVHDLISWENLNNTNIFYFILFIDNIKNVSGFKITVCT